MNMEHSISKENITELIERATAARGNAYAPYSNFLVGAALLCENNKGMDIVTGCNIENASYGAAVCAERTAIFKAVSMGQRKFRAIALVSGALSDEYKRGEAYTGELMRIQYPSPCGICRQVMREFADPGSFYIIMAKTVDDYRIMTLEEMLPESFGPDYL